MVVLHLDLQKKTQPIQVLINLFTVLKYTNTVVLQVRSKIHKVGVERRELPMILSRETLCEI